MLQTEETSRRRVDLATGLMTDLWFFWDSAHTSLEIQLLTVNGTIAGAYPRSISKAERLPIHRKFVPVRGSTTWYLRIAADGKPLAGLSITVEFQDRMGRTRTAPIAVGLEVRPDRVLAIERVLDVPEELLL